MLGHEVFSVDWRGGGGAVAAPGAVESRNLRWQARLGRQRSTCCHLSNSCEVTIKFATSSIASHEHSGSCHSQTYPQV